MDITFRDLYEEMVTIERSLERMELDVNNVECDTATKCLLEDELASLRSAYSRLLESEFKFKDIRFDEVIKSINNCMDCMSIY